MKMLFNYQYFKLRQAVFIALTFFGSSWVFAAEITIGRFFHDSTNRHFYVSSDAERETLISGAQPGWEYEGEAAQVYNSEEVNTIAITRFRRLSNSEHIYVRPGSEYNSLNNNTAEFINEGTAFWAPTSGDPVYRLKHDGFTVHFYTKSAAERDNAVSQFGYVYEGIGFYSIPENLERSIPQPIISDGETTGGELNQFEIVTTQDKNYPGQDGWVREIGTNSNFWISGPCRTDLLARQITQTILPWTVISAMGNATSIPCSEISTGYQSGGPFIQPVPAYYIITTWDKNIAGSDGWVREAATGKKFWIDGTCRSYLLDQKNAQQRILDWPVISSMTNRDSIACTDIEVGTFY